MASMLSRLSAAVSIVTLAASLSSGLAMAGSLYVADRGAGDVLRYDLPSTSGAVFGSGANPELYGLATGASGQVYTVNNSGDLIRRFGANGSLSAGFGTAGEVDIKTMTSGAAFGPVGVAFSPVAGGQLIVSAYNSQNLLRLDASTGAWDSAFGTSGLVTTTANPLGVAYSAAGDYIYVAQTDNSVLRVNAAGTDIAPLVFSGAPTSSTWSLALATDSELFIADNRAGEVLKYTVSGLNATLDPGYGTSGRVTLVDGVYGIAVAADGTAYVTSESSGTVTIISSDGQTVTTFASGLSAPTGIAFSPSQAVPEIDPAGVGSVLALLTGALGLLERRRTNRPAAGSRASGLSR